MRLSVVICTRNRPEILESTLAALDAQTDADFELVVVDDGDELDAALAARAARDARLRVLRDRCKGLSAARNLGWRSASGEWVAFLDDDCVPEPEWIESLRRAIDAYPDVDFVGGHVSARSTAGDDYVVVTVHEPRSERVLSGRWTRPWDIGFTISMAAPRRVYESVGGFDERLGPGAPHFPSSEDVDFNYRLLRGGGRALVTPTIRSWHDQWRSPVALAPHFRGYMAGWCGFAMKHVRRGDVAGGLWLWHWGLRDTARMFGSAARRRSPLRFRIAVWKLRGLAYGTWHGARQQW